MKYEEMNYDEQQKVVAMVAYWLKPYTDEVIKRVMARADEIINDEMTMKLVEELYNRGQKEDKHFVQSVEMLFRDFEGFKQYDVHNNVLEHAGSYRDVLYDMYIRKV